MQEVILEIKETPAYEGINFQYRLRPYSSRVSNYHDRRVSARFEEAAPQDGETAAPATGGRRQRRREGGKAPKTRTVIAELTGGISMLMDASKETRIYVFTEK